MSVEASILDRACVLILGITAWLFWQTTRDPWPGRRGKQKSLVIPMGKWRPAGSVLGGVLAPRNRAEGLERTVANCCTIGELSTGN
jgi:hypothetical protein